VNSIKLLTASGIKDIWEYQVDIIVMAELLQHGAEQFNKTAKAHLYSWQKGTNNGVQTQFIFLSKIIIHSTQHLSFH
jgi:hypothetical protein